MKTALLLSPHLDDAAFSAGGTMALLADRGWRVVMATVFARSVPAPRGFALACQTDKGLGPEVDYMALRRAEDLVAGRVLGVRDIRWLPFAEAPHRGYDSAAALFAGVRAGDGAAAALQPAFAALIGEVAPDWVLAPQGLGNHVDHLVVIEALRAVAAGLPIAFWRDAPYVIRDPAARAVPEVAGLARFRVPVAAGLDRKVAAACAYGSQLGFQFGGAVGAEAALRAFDVAEGGETFLGADAGGLGA